MERNVSEQKPELPFKGHQKHPNENVNGFQQLEQIRTLNSLTRLLPMSKSKFIEVFRMNPYRGKVPPLPRTVSKSYLREANGEPDISMNSFVRGNTNYLFLSY